MGIDQYLKFDKSILEEPVLSYLIDVYLPEWDLGIELDGPHHSPKRDAIRDENIFKASGIKIIRFKNKEIKLKKVPKLDDEFAKDLGVVKTLDELKKKIKEEAENHPNITKFLEGKSVKRVIYIPEKLINFVA